METPKFDGVKDLIVALRWISVVEGSFYICSCPENLKVKFALLLRLGVKDWWKFSYQIFFTMERAVVTCKQFMEMFSTEYVLLL